MKTLVNTCDVDADVQAPCVKTTADGVRCGLTASSSSTVMSNEVHLEYCGQLCYAPYETVVGYRDDEQLLFQSQLRH